MLATVLLCQQILLMFTKYKERKKAKCQLCSKELAFHSGATNLREHLMNRHSGSYKGDGAKKKKQGTLQTFAGAKRCSEARAKEITDRIANFVICRIIPGQDHPRTISINFY